MMTISNGYNLSKEHLIEAIFHILEENYSVSPWTKEQIASDLNQENTDYFLLSENQHLVGFLAIQDLFGEIELTNIAIAKSFQGKGLSHLLMQHIDEMTQPIFLEVRVSNQKSQNLYRQHGFKPMGRRKNYYHNPIEDALIMKRDGKD